MADRPVRSLRADLAWSLALLMSILWLVAAVAGWLTMRHEVDEVYDAALKRAAERIVGLIDEEPHPTAHLPLISKGGGLYVEIRDADGQILMQSTRLDPAVMPPPKRNGFDEVADLRTYTRQAENGMTIRVADPLDERREAAMGTIAAFIIAIGIAFPLNIWAIYRLSRNRLRPVTEFSAEVATRGATRLDPLRTPDLPLELLPVEQSVNRLMARLDQALNAERSFSANAAHELRTPIAAMLAQTQRLVAESPDGPLRDRARAIAEEEKRLARLAEKLLDLTRAEASGSQSAPPRDMRDVAALTLRDFDAPIRYQPPDAPAQIPMDVDGFSILLRNLVENALIHGTPPIEVELSDGLLVVRNGGTPVPADRLPVLTDRFERAGSRAKGSGLGLAIVEALVQRADGVLKLSSPIPGQTTGFEARVSFPRA